jgi:hypothetical protein
MKRTRRTVKVITSLGDGIFEERSVIYVAGGGRPSKELKTVIHGTYREVGEPVEMGKQDESPVPVHSKVYIDPMGFKVHFLRRIR